VTAADLAVLVERVVADRELHGRLLMVREKEAFVTEVVAVAAELGLDVDATDVREGLRSSREWWLMRWV
jgi:hypothetical protein